MRKLKYKLDYVLKSRGMTQDALAELMQVKSPMISQMKRGGLIVADRWSEMAQILGVPVDSIKGRADGPEFPQPPEYSPPPLADTAARLEYLEHQVQLIKDQLTALITASSSEPRPPFQAPIVPRREPQTIK